MILFLDFDGVLHPDEVYLEQGEPVLRGPGDLFMWAPLLIDALGNHPDVRVVLSTSWARHLGFAKAKGALPEPLRRRVIGATASVAVEHGGWGLSGSTDWWDDATRYQQIARYVRRAGITHWVALDDDETSWPADKRQHLILTQGDEGISAPSVLGALAAALAAVRTG